MIQYRLNASYCSPRSIKLFGPLQVRTISKATTTVSNFQQSYATYLVIKYQYHLSAEDMLSRSKARTDYIIFQNAVF